MEDDLAAAAASVAGLSIVDAHQHFWDPVANYHPWLSDEPPIPFRYGDYRAIRRPYLPPDYRRDARPIAVDGSVYVETEWDPRDPIGEMRYVESLRARTGLPTVVVAQAWLDRRRCRGRARAPGGVSVRAQRAAQAARECGAVRRAGRHDRSGVAPRLRSARAPRPALRPADAVVASSRGGAPRRRLSRRRRSSSTTPACRPIAARGHRRLDAPRCASSPPARTSP